MKFSIALHIIGIVLWVGTLLILSLTTFLIEKNNLNKKDFSIVANKLLYAGIIPGFFITLITGIIQIFIYGFGFYMKQGWFHGKLTFLIVLTIVSVVFVFFVKDIEKNKWPAKGKLMAIHGTTGVCFALIIFLTILGR